MSDSLTLIQELLLEVRESQSKGNTTLTELRVEVAALQRSNDGQAENIANMRAEMRQLSDRVHNMELKVQPLMSLENRYSALETRVRSLEGDGREHKVVARAVAGGAREIWRYVIGAIAGLILALATVAAKNGGLPG